MKIPVFLNLKNSECDNADSKSQNISRPTSCSHYSAQLSLLHLHFTLRNFRQFCYVQGMKTLSNCFIQFCAPCWWAS